MSTLLDPTFRLNLTAWLLDPFPVATGRVEVGARILERIPATANFAIASKIRLGADSDSVAFSLTDFGFTVSQAPVPQVETATAVGTVTASGSLGLTLTSALINSPRIVGVPVLVDDTAADWAAKARAALAADEIVSTHFTVSGAGTAIVLTAKVPTYNDASLNLAIANGTAAGITEAPSSASTTAGIHGVQIGGYIGNGKDSFGQDLPTLPFIHALLLYVVKGPEGSALEDVGEVTATQSTLRPGSAYIVTNIPTIDLAANTLELARAGTGDSPLCVELVIIGGPTPL